ncbi:hypothetical protein [uncultured Roseobacter sp.]|uniref:hypothetical protein n=1 Tax=uncultured Roseobacter sp. TaxID=114847 RepID=UPI002619911B|nr:hypothetical protein [uncultured Roseobacter sp.]
MSLSSDIVFWSAAATASIAAGVCLWIVAVMTFMEWSGALGGAPSPRDRAVTLVALGTGVLATAIPVAFMIVRVRGRGVPRSLKAGALSVALVTLGLAAYAALADFADFVWFGAPLALLGGSLLIMILSHKKGLSDVLS